MGLFKDYRGDDFRFSVWKMEENIDELLTLLPDNECYAQRLSQFSSLHRQLEWLSVRVLLYTMVGEHKEIVYEQSGKPFLKDGSYHISISHTRGYVTLILSALHPVGIDIEQYSERVSKISSRFVRSDEVVTLYKGVDTWSLLLLWSAKEVMFKCMSRVEVDFKKHLKVFPFQVVEEGILEAQEYHTADHRLFSIHYLVQTDFVLTWCVDKL